MRGVAYDELELRALFRGGLSYAEIAQELGRTTSGIEHKLHALGLRRKMQWTADAISSLEWMVFDGWSDKRIAKKLHTTPYAVERERARRKLSPREGVYSRTQLAALLGVARETVRQWTIRGYIRHKWICNHEVCAITYEYLMVFLEDSTYWPLWRPSRIRDIPIALYAKSIRKNDPKYLTMRDVGKALGLAPCTITQHVVTPSMRRLYLGNKYYVRVDWFLEWLQEHPQYKIVDNSLLITNA